VARQPVVSVRGQAVIEVPPEIAQFVLTVTARDPRRDRTLERLAARNEECLALIRGYGDAVERVETSGLAVYPELKLFGRREQVRSYWGTVRISVTVVDFTILGELVARAADGEMTTLDGPWWRLRPDSPVHRRARQEAAQDALTRAREYAEAVGSRLTGLIRLADEPQAAGVAMAADLARPMAFAARARRAPEAEPEPIDLEPQVQVVRAGVEARFTIAEPELQ
jgi:hypothetical protein